MKHAGRWSAARGDTGSEHIHDTDATVTIAICRTATTPTLPIMF
jgi:hypothetical protein